MQRRKSEKRIPIIRDKNFTEFYPDAKQWVKRITKVVLNHLDGTTSEIKLEFPIYSFWREPQEKSNYYLSAWINDLSRHWIKITSYEVFLGSINDKGEESYSICYGIDEIPLNKVWVPAKEAGEWMKPEDVKRDP